MTALRHFIGELRLPLFRNAIALLLSSVLTGGLGLVYWAVAARLYPVTDVGVGASLVSILIFVGGISQLNLQSALYRYVPRAGSAAGRLVAGTYAWVLGSAFVVGVLTAVAGSVFNLVPPEVGAIGFAEYLLFIGSVVIWSLFSFQDYVLASLRLTVWVPLETVIFSVGKLGLLFVVTGLHPFGVFVSWMVPAVAGVVMVSGAIWIYLRHLHRPRHQTTAITLRGVARFAAGDYLAGVFNAAASSLLPVLVFVMLGPLQSAYFYPVMLIVTLLWLVPSALMSSLLVEASAGTAQFGRDGRRVVGLMALALIPPVLLLVIAAPLVLQIFGADYAEAGALPMRLLALSTVPYVVKTYANYLARFHGNVRRVVLTEAGVAVPAVALTVLLAPVMGLAGVALAVLIGLTFAATVVSLASLRQMISAWRSAG